MERSQISEAAAGAHRPTLGVVIVTHNSATDIERSIPAIADQLRPGDQLIVCDNGSTDETRTVVRRLAPEAVLIESTNVGFAAGCNAGVAASSTELICLLNPDAVVASGFRDAIELPVLEQRGWDAWQGLVTSDGGATVNVWGGVVHYTGVAWAGGAGRPIAEAPSEPREVSFASGACLAARRDAWECLGGFSPPYFLYHEDTDLGLRMWLAGMRVGLEPRARCDHDYDFDKGLAKWLYLERNRWATILRTYPTALIALLAPALVAVELAIHLAAATSGWLPQKLRADRDVIRSLPRLLGERKRMAGERRITTPEFASLLAIELDSAFLGRLGSSPLANRFSRAWWRAVLAVLGRLA